MDILFLGTPEFALPSLRTLINSPHCILAVITTPDRPKGRHQRITAPPVKKLALAENLKILQPENLKAETVKSQLEALKPDLGVVVAYGKLIPPWLISLPGYGCINLHPSLLPKFRGAAPIQRGIIKGCKKTGVTTILMDEGFDSGDILLQEQTPIYPEETARELSERLANLGATIIIETIEGLLKNTLVPKKQVETEATFAPIIRKEETEIDWKESAEKIRNKIRALNPKPGAWTVHKNKRLKIWKAKKIESDQLKTAKNHQVPGTIVVDNKRRAMGVVCGKGFLFLEEIQPENRKRMTSEDYCRGHLVKTGERLGA